ncbi:DNA cytosine methyltransferase [Streptomyces sp. DSM 44917]|uniref:DNA (cytosine-5-)-methyltransferase n=1 Tax=Streptomyces boetiae TaxID=3075541 RepID=A0ABU2LAJ5_9ACTN|nr:DNA cytosine methyltransferase [Streptomyces sp. DSM 44917]MDT0308362.1 DNA cytosine methyltransferase [Streptomyces sp. DSM 44917]
MLGPRLTSLEVCAGAGGLAQGLEMAGFDPVALIENNAHCCATLRANRLGWRVLETDLLSFDPAEHTYVYDIDLLSAGLPRVKSPASVRRTEDEYERGLLEATVWLVAGVRPRAVLIENVPALVSDDAFTGLREFVRAELEHLGYVLRWNILNAGDFGLAQDRKVGVLVALHSDAADAFRWPEPNPEPRPTVGTALWKSMAARGWRGAAQWAAQADRLAPAIVGGSENRGGADLGPTGTKKAWARMGINGGSIGDQVPGPEYRWDPAGPVAGLPKLTVEQVAILQGFPANWHLQGGKTARYRQLGHASPPPVARALGESIAAALR